MSSFSPDAAVPGQDSGHYALPSGDTLDVLLFSNVTNMSELLQLSNNQHLSAALIKASLIPDVFPLLCAATRSSWQSQRKQLRTRDLYSELAFNLAPSNHVNSAHLNSGHSIST